MQAIIRKMNEFPFEIKEMDRFIENVNLIDELIEHLKQLSPEEIDNLSSETFKNINNSIVGLSYSLHYVNGFMSRLDEYDLLPLREKLNTIGHAFLSLSKFFLPIISQEYLTALRTSKSLINYDSAIIESLDLEIKIIAHKLNKEGYS